MVGLVMKIKVGVGYARTSGKINPKSSILNQVQAIQSYCDKHKIFLKHIYIDDCKSGTKVEGRLEYQLLKEDLKSQSDIDMVLVAFADRLGRESYEFIHTVELIRETNKELICISEGLSSQTITPLQLVMLAIQSEMENKQRYQRLRDSKDIKIKQGQYLLSKPPFGYVWDENRYLIKDPKKAVIAEKVYTLFDQGYKVGTISRMINEEYGPIITDVQVNNILSNKTYTGYIYLKDKNDPNSFKKISEVRHSEIISLDIFERCFKKLKKKNTRKRSTVFYLLNQGVFLCPHCREGVYGKTEYYRCENKCWKMEKEKLNCKVIDYFLFIEAQNDVLGKESEYETLLLKKEQLEICFAHGELNYNQLKIKLNIIQQKLNTIKAKKIKDDKTRYSSIINSGNWEQLKRLLIDNKVKLTMDDNENIISIQ